MRLVIQSDAQDDSALQAALSFSAIEALICTSRLGVVEELSRKAAALLESNSLEREKAIRTINELYEVRTKVFHGEGFPAEAERVANNSRTLAAGVLFATYEWIEHARRMGADEAHASFAEELESSVISGKAFVGVPESLRACLLPWSSE